jgi:uncharacterized protein YebE (UPF0316 family)
MLKEKFTKVSSYTKHITTIIFIVGFVVDMIVLPDISNRLTQYIGLAYLVIIGLCIILREYVVSRNAASHFEQRMYSFFTFCIAYFSGSALSFVFVYAFRAASLSVSWPLFIILLICICANEFVGAHRFRFTLDVGIYFIALLFYIIFNLPLLIGTQNETTFLLSLAASFVISFLYVLVLRSTSDMSHSESPRCYALAFGVPLFVGMLYLLNILPAVPVSLYNAGVYHTMTKTDDGRYIGSQEEDTRILSYFKHPVFHFGPFDSAVYFYASVNAPAQLTAPITQSWEKYDANKKKWEQSTIVSYNVSGGREGGYRAYSAKENVTDGLWRVTVSVDTNRVVGRITFYVQKTSINPQTKERVFE